MEIPKDALALLISSENHGFTICVITSSDDARGRQADKLIWLRSPTMNDGIVLRACLCGSKHPREMIALRNLENVIEAV